MIRFQKKRFSKTVFPKKFLPGDFRKGLEKHKFVQNYRSKHLSQKTGAKIQPKKARPKSQANSNKKSIQISKQQPAR